MPLVCTDWEGVAEVMIRKSGDLPGTLEVCFSLAEVLPGVLMHCFEAPTDEKSELFCFRRICEEGSPLTSILSLRERKKNPFSLREKVGMRV